MRMPANNDPVEIDVENGSPAVHGNVFEYNFDYIMNLLKC